MRKKLSITTMALILIFSLFCGCLGSEVADDQVIILDSNTPTFNVDVQSDQASVQWFVDDQFIREDAMPEDGPLYFVLDRDNYDIGDHVLKVTDSDSERSWTFSVKDHSSAASQQAAATISTSAERGYDYSTPWEERHTKAEAYWDTIGRNK